MTWKQCQRKAGVLGLVAVAWLVMAGTAGAEASSRLSAVNVAERDSVLEIAFDLSGPVEHQLSFSPGAVRMTLSPVEMTSGRQVYGVRHPLLSRVVARQVGTDRVTVWLLTDNFDARQLEGAIRVLPSEDGLRLTVGQALLASAGSEAVAGEAEAQNPASAGMWASLSALRENLPSRDAVAAMGAMLLASLLGVALVRLVNRRRAHGLKVLSRVNVGAGRRILLVQAEGRRLLVSMEPAGMRLIADLEEGSELQPVPPELIPEELLRTPRFAFAQRDVRKLGGKGSPILRDSDELEIAS